MDRLVAAVSGLMMIAIGALHLLAPQLMMQAPHIDLVSVNHFHIIRAAYGGAYIGIGAFFLLGAFMSQWRKASLTAIAFIFCGFAAGRLISIAADGVPVTLYLGVLVFEIVFAALAAVCLKKSG